MKVTSVVMTDACKHTYLSSASEFSFHERRKQSPTFACIQNSKPDIKLNPYHSMKSTKIIVIKLSNGETFNPYQQIYETQ